MIRKHETTLKSNKTIWKRISEHKTAYLFLLPAIAFAIIFQYSTIYGITLAFKDYQFNKGILGSPWVGFKYFEIFLNQPDFWKIVLTTVKFSMASLVFGFPAPIIMALMLNEVRQTQVKKVIQTVSYLPHFVSWVVVMALFQNLLSPYNGLINELLAEFFGKEPIYFLGEPKYFLPLYILIGMWKEIGWGTILYLATIAGIDQSLYEAATIDGAGRLKQTWYITLPSLAGVIGLQLIMQVGGVLNVGFDQVYLMQTPATIDVSEVLSTYLVKMGIKNGQYSFGTAVGLFQTLVGFILMYITNWLSRKYLEVSMW